MNRKFVTAALALGLAASAGAASAHGWGFFSINLGAPIYARPAYVGPVYAPAPVVVAPAPAPVAYSCSWIEGHWRWNGWRNVWVPGHCAYPAGYVAAAPSGSVSIGYAGRF